MLCSSTTELQKKDLASVLLEEDKHRAIQNLVTEL